MAREILHYVYLVSLLAFCSCKLCYLTQPSCLLAPGATTNVKTNKYYRKEFTKTDTILSTKYVYDLVDTLTNNSSKYRYKSFLFYDNGLVLESVYYTDSLRKDTVRAPTNDLIKACCHGWSIGTFIVRNDTVFFGAKPGYIKEWAYYSAKIYNDRLIIFLQQRGKIKDTTVIEYRKNSDRQVSKTIKILKNNS